jgi:class 3 adenylate cyclase
MYSPGPEVSPPLPSGSLAAPASPAGRRRPLRFSGRHEVAISPAEAWRVLGDTDHMNRLLRLNAVDFSPPQGADAGFVRRARTRLLGASFTYREHPFEWVRERGYTILREFDSGPFASARFGVELEPRPAAVQGGGREPGVNLVAWVDLVPASLAGRLLAGVVGPRVAGAMLRYLGSALEERARGGEALPLPAGRAPVDEARLARGLARLARASVDAGLLPRLRERLARGTDAQVLRIRPYETADDWGADRLAVLRLFLHATRAGLFELKWELMCPACRVPKAEVGGLAELPERYHCDACGIDYETDFDRRVELRFSVHPSVRRAADEVYCIGGPLRTPHVVLQQRLGPGETRSVAARLTEELELRAVGAMRALPLLPGPARHAESPAPPALHLRYADGAWHADAASPEALVYSPGELVLELRNATAAPLLVQVETTAWDSAAATAAQVTALQEFRDLFSSEVLAPGQEVGVSTVALLFSDLRGSTSLYEGVGDAPAFGRVNRHFDFLRATIARNQGAVVKTIGDAVMGAFASLEDALRSGIEIQREIGAWCAAQGIEPAFELRVGVHAGPAIAVNANERLDYFGRTVNLAARVERESEGGDVVLLREVFEDPDVGRALAGYEVSVEPFRARLRGIADSVPLVRLRPVPAAPAPRGGAAAAVRASAATP